MAGLPAHAPGQVVRWSGGVRWAGGGKGCGQVVRWWSHVGQVGFRWSGGGGGGQVVRYWSGIGQVVRWGLCGGQVVR